MESSILHPAVTERTGVMGQDVSLHGFSYEDRRLLLPLVVDVISSGGCWLRERRITSFTQVQFHFEMQLRSAMDIYSGLVGTGLELTPSSHAGLTGLCTVRCHKDAFHEGPRRVLNLRLEVSFMEDQEFDLQFESAGLA